MQKESIRWEQSQPMTAVPFSTRTGQGQPIVFSHGWPLSSDDWGAQMLFFGQKGYRVTAHDRRGHGRSTQTWDGTDIDTHAYDLAQLTEKLDLREAIHVGHSTGGGGRHRWKHCEPKRKGTANSRLLRCGDDRS